MLGEAPLLAVRLSTYCDSPLVAGLRRVETGMGRARFWCGLGVAALLMVGCTPDLVPGDAEAPLTASGTIRATEVRVASELGGRIQSGLVHEGDAVGTGEVIVTLDPTPWELELLPAEARASAARAELAVLEDGPRATEVELSWKILDPVIAHWRRSAEIDTYEAGTWGPRSADELIGRDGRAWRRA